MNSNQFVDATLPTARRYEHDREHDWKALERFGDLATRAGHPVAADDFMWMGAAEFHDGRTIHSYKHVDTRRYLHLDDSGHTYRFLSRAEGGRYAVLPEPHLAIEALELDPIARRL